MKINLKSLIGWRKNVVRDEVQDEDMIWDEDIVRDENIIQAEKKLLPESVYLAFGEVYGISDERMIQLHQWARKENLNDFTFVAVLDREKTVPVSDFLSEYELSLIAPELSCSGSRKEYEYLTAFKKLYHQERLKGKPIAEAFAVAKQEQKVRSEQHHHRRMQKLTLASVFLLALSGISSWGQQRQVSDPDSSSSRAANNPSSEQAANNPSSSRAANNPSSEQANSSSRKAQTKTSDVIISSSDHLKKNSHQHTR